MHLRLFLVRHGETVDNVAGIIAGVRDSPLTSHGFQQARRLGSYLNATDIDITHIYASPLQRAATTAEQVWLAQPEATRKTLSVIPSSLIQEQDFGLCEGLTYAVYRASDEQRQSVETTQMMARRADLFIEQYLDPLLENPHAVTAVIVSHGRMLQVIWTQILAWLKPESVKCDRQLLVDTSSLDYTHIGAWSNTGFVDATFRRQLKTVLSSDQSQISRPASGNTDHTESTSELTTVQQAQHKEWTRWDATISAINGRHHLSGLVRTKGGVGSSRHDAQQSTLDKFFARHRPAG